MMIWVRRILITLGILYLCLAIAVFIAQRNFLYFPPDGYHNPPERFAEIKTDTGILGWYSPAKDNHPTVMIFHGNASSIDSNLHIFRDLQTAGYGVWSVGYPGFPGNAGPPSQKEIVKAARAQYETLRAQGVTNIVFYGTSLGTGVASQLASYHEPNLLILDAPFNSMADMVKRHIKFLPTSLLLQDTWKSHNALKDVDVPLIWIHGTADSVVEISQGQKLYDGYKGPKAAHKLSGSRHSNNWLNGGREITLRALETL